MDPHYRRQMIERIGKAVRDNEPPSLGRTEATFEALCYVAATSFLAMQPIGYSRETVTALKEVAHQAMLDWVEAYPHRN